MKTSPDLWQRRWDSIDKMIAILLERYEPFQRESAAQREHTIFALLVQLQRFGKAQYRFFHDGFFAKRFVDLGAIPHQGDREFSMPRYLTGYNIEQHVLSTTFDQIAADVVVMQRVSEQRLINLLRGGPSGVGSALSIVDKLAYTAIRSLSAYLTNSQETVLTYFHKSANVRVIPYAPVAMIGIPITTLGIHRESGVNEDLLAIPHEVAHHLYWNGKANDTQSIQQALVEGVGSNEVIHWTEEIFADVVGCLLGGPAMARSFIEMQLAKIGPAFIETANHHPTPALRPYLYIYTLEKMGMNTIAAEIRSIWEEILKERMVFVNRAHLFASYEIVDTVLAVVEPSRLNSHFCWSEGDVSYELLYKNFSSRIPTLIGKINDKDLDSPEMQMNLQWKQRAAQISGMPALNDLPTDWASPDRGGENGVIQLDAEAWLRIYDFGGWITSGPNGGNISDD